MDYMFKEGFLHTKAPLFMDEVAIVVALLPLLLTYAIYLAKTGKYKAHGIFQLVLYIAGVIFVGYFEYGVRVMGGFAELVKNSAVDHSFLYIFLSIHVLIAIISILTWSYTIFMGVKNFKNMKSKEFRYNHRKIARLAYLGVTLTSLTGIGLYILLFVF
jgi:putative membrane protein